MSRNARLVFLAALAARGLYLLAVGPALRYAMTPDTIGYATAASNLREHGAFSQSAAPPLEPDTVRTPLYPLFLAAFPASGSARAVEWAQALVGAATAALVFELALVLWESEAAALAAGLCAALDPILLMHTPLLLTETLFLLVFCAGLRALARGLREGSPRAAAAAGLFFGLSALTRPVALYFFVPAGLLAAWTRRARAAWLAAFLVASAALPLAWMTRNKARSGVFTFCSIQGLNFVVRTASVQAELAGVGPGEAFEQVEAMLKAEHPAPFSTKAEEARFKGRWAARFIVHHPVAYLRVAAKDVVKVLGGHGSELAAWQLLKDPYYDPMTTTAPTGGLSGTRGLLARHWPLRVFIPVYLLALAELYVFAALGFNAAWREGRKSSAAFCLLVVAYYLALTAGLGSYYRLRIPLLPAIYALAGLGLHRFLGQTRHPPRGG